MTILQFKYAAVTAEYGSISAAADRLYMAQPSLSKALHELESELGFAIFIRGRRGVKISTEGEEFLQYARRVLEQNELLEERYLQKKYGRMRKQKKRLSVSTQHIALSNQAFAALLQQYGGDEYIFSIRTVNTLQVVDDVRSRRSELGVLVLRKDNRAILERILRENDLDFHELISTKVMAWVKVEHPLAKKEILTPEELLNWTIVSYQAGNIGASYVSEEINLGLIFPKIVYVTDAGEILRLLGSLQAVHLSGEGLMTTSKDVVAIPVDCDELLTVGIIRNRNTFVSTLGSLFLEELELAGKGESNMIAVDSVYVRKAMLDDLPEIMEIYSYARQFMADTGNPLQWGTSYPPQQLVVRDIRLGECHVCILNRRVEAVFSFSNRKTKGYDRIYDGQWLKTGEPYCTIHRLASRGTQKGMSELCFKWCSVRCSDLRADTHDNNKIMQHLLNKNGFHRCGHVHIEDNSSRIAYQKLTGEEPYIDVLQNQ